MDIISAALLLFFIMDPLGNIPLFLSVLKDVPPERRQRIVWRELLIALAAMAIFIFCGRYVLQALQLSQESLSIAGGIILFIIALKMIFPKGHPLVDESLVGEPLVVPLAIPGVAGPSAFATLLLLVSRDPDRIWWWTLAMVIAWAATAVLVLPATFLYRVLGSRGLAAMERLMGMLLVAMAVQMFLDGLQEHLHRSAG